MGAISKEPYHEVTGFNQVNTAEKWAHPSNLDVPTDASQLG